MEEEGVGAEEEEVCMVEAALFVHEGAASKDELSKLLKLEPERCERALERLCELYEKRAGGVEVVRVGDGYLMQASPRFASKLKRIAQVELPAPVLRTLSMIAYHQPIKQSKLANRRGNKAYSHVKVLVDRGLVQAVPDAHTKMLTTTPLFASYFQLEGEDVDAVRKAMLEMMHTPKLACTPMTSSLLTLAGVLEFDVLNLYADEGGEHELTQYDAVVCLAVHAGSWGDAKQLVQLSCATLSALSCSLDELSAYGSKRDIQRAKRTIHEALSHFRKRAGGLGVRVNPLSPVARKMAQELSLDISEGGVRIASDVYEGRAQVRIPTHQDADTPVLKRVVGRYEALLSGLEGKKSKLKKS
ncbi:MAG: SMC-Scp complex subunit ScpB [Methermicoccaceae archaeon]